MAALAEEQTEELDREDVCASINPCFAFRVPPAAREGHKAAVWKEAGHVWTGKLNVVTTIRSNRCMLKLINPDGKPFAIFPIKAPGSDGPKSIERTIDSGRYFAILIEDPKTKRRSNIGIGFSERAQAFEFNVAIQRWEEQYKREEQGEKLLVSSESSLQKLKAEAGTKKITINIGGRKKKSEAAATKSGATNGGGLLAPPSTGGLKAPSGAGRRRRGKKKATAATGD